MTRYIRKEKILDYIKDKKICSIEELQDYFSVSLSTIHRDLNDLLREGRIDKFYGKVAFKTEQNYYKSRIEVNVDLKRRIANKALNFVSDGDCIFLDNSTTVYYFAEVLSKSGFKNVLVVSNSAFLSHLFLESNNIEFICLGGKLNKDLNCFVGIEAEKSIENFNGSKYFLSTASISEEGGISDIYVPEENVIKVKMHEFSRESFLLVDSTKFGKESTVKWFDINDMDHIITDNGIDEKYVKQCKERGIDIVIA